MEYPENIRFLVLALAARNCLLVVAGLFVLDRLLGGRVSRFLRSAERRWARLANRRQAAIAFVFFFVIVIRTIVLPLLKVPVPGGHDEFSYLLAGDTFSNGRLSNPTHPLWPSFDTFHVLSHPTYASIYPPAQGFALAVGETLGLPWLGVVLSVAAMCAAILWMLQAWMPARWAFLGAALAAMKFGVASYWINSYWGGAMAAIGGALVLGALPRLRRRRRIREALLLGLGIAILANSRPVEGFILCVPAAIYFFWIMRTGARETPPGRSQLAIAGSLAAVLIPTFLFMAYYNWRVTGDPLLFPHVIDIREHGTMMLLWDSPRPPKTYANAQFDQFFNHHEGVSYRPTASEVLRVTADKFTEYSFCYFWAGVLLLAPTALAALRTRKLRLLAVTLALAGAGSLIVIWSFPHYISGLTAVIFAFLVQGVRRLRALPGRFRPWGRLLSRAAVLLLVAVTARYASGGVCDSLGWCRGLVDRQVILDRLKADGGRHLVFVHYRPEHDPGREWVYNDADIDAARVVWARHLGPAQNGKVLRYFRDRHVWEVDPDANPPVLKPFR